MVRWDDGVLNTKLVSFNFLMAVFNVLKGEDFFNKSRNQKEKWKFKCQKNVELKGKVENDWRGSQFED
jgi:hypothetical protein